MTQFHAELRERVAATLMSLHEARATGDDHLAEIRVGELESLARVAREHDLLLDELAEFGPSPAIAT